MQPLVLIANHAINRKSSDFVECQVMNRILGAEPGSFSRLVHVLREEKGYAYDIKSGFSATAALNHFWTSASVRREATEQALAEILKQFASLRETAVPASELAAAKSATVARFALGLESSAGVLALWLEQRQMGLPEDYWDTFPKRVAAVTADDVMRVAKKYVPLDNPQVVVVADIKMAEMLKKFGQLEIMKE